MVENKSPLSRAWEIFEGLSSWDSPKNSKLYISHLPPGSNHPNSYLHTCPWAFKHRVHNGWLWGMVIPPSIGNPSNEYINYWVDDHSLLHGNKPQHTLIIYNSRNHSKDPSKGSRFKRIIQSWDRVNSQFSSVQIPIGSILLIGELGSS